MDEVEPIISRLNGIDPSRPYFDPLAAEEALRRHARLIGFLDPSFSWAMGPREAAHELSGVDFESPAGCRWRMTMQALHDQAVADLQRDAHMLPQIKATAEKLLVNHPENVDPLIYRWLGHSEQYAQA